MLEILAEGVVIYDAEARIVFANLEAEKILGLPRERMLGRSHDEISRQMSAGRRANSDEAILIETVLRTGEPVYGHEHLHRNGSKGDRIVSANAAAVRDRVGAIIGVATVFDDITERTRTARALHQSEERIVEILESVSDAFFALDLEWRFAYVNQRGADLLRRDRRDLIRRRC